MKSKILIIATLMAMIFAGCNKEEKKVSPPPPENEFITTVQLVATNTADTSDVVTGKWIQLDPAGTPDLTQANLTLRKNSIYKVAVSFLDESKSPAEDITEEVHERANYHLVCYEVASGLNMVVQRTDKDTNVPQLELGLESRFTTTDPSTGGLAVSLHHQPNVKNGDCDRGSTDVDVNFSITIQ